MDIQANALSPSVLSTSFSTSDLQTLMQAMQSVKEEWERGLQDIRNLRKEIRGEEIMNKVEHEIPQTQRSELDRSPETKNMPEQPAVSVPVPSSQSSNPSTSDMVSPFVAPSVAEAVPPQPLSRTFTGFLGGKLIRRRSPIHFQYGQQRRVRHVEKIHRHSIGYAFLSIFSPTLDRHHPTYDWDWFRVLKAS